MRKKVSADMSALGIILERQWDPAGVYHDLSDDPWPSGEYDTYAGWIIGHLSEPRSADAHSWVTVSVFSCSVGG